MVQYLATPSSPELRAAMSSGHLGCMTTPAQGNVVPDGAMYACDNSRFGCDGKGRLWPGYDRWWMWLVNTVDRYGPERCLWALAPDVPFDPVQTLADSAVWLPRIRSLGIPAAFAAQDGCENGLVPWGEFDVLFLAGSAGRGTPNWKIGPAAEALCREALDRGVRIHMGRVNSEWRLRRAEEFGCHTVDGTYSAKFPDVFASKVFGWLDAVHDIHQPSLFGGAA